MSNNREYLQLAQNYSRRKHCIAGWYASEKLDGMRAYWDGGISCGILTHQIFYANSKKDYKRVTPPRSTGLWSRYGKVINAPDWWVAKLPKIPLDGELYIGHGAENFATLISIVKQGVPNDDDWKRVRYIVFDTPSDYSMFSPGRINNVNCKLIIPEMRDRIERDIHTPAWAYYRAYSYLQTHYEGKLELMPQKRLSMSTVTAENELEEMLIEITDAGGEGIMLRKPESVWTPKRTEDLLKVKKYLDSEGVVVGHNWGRGKYDGMLGSLSVMWTANKVTFDLSGFTDEERAMPSIFNVGDTVTFRYREVTKDGKPKEARYWRKSMSKVQSSI
jgi:DNA ligase 1